MKTPEDEAFEEIERRQGGFHAKQRMAADKVLDLDGHVVGKVRKPKRPWVGLTDADIERIKLMTYEKETNADGEEQEAVNIDWLIKTAEHFCKEKNT